MDKKINLLEISRRSLSKDLSQDTVRLITRKSRLYLPFSFNFEKTCSWEIETNYSMIILLFPSVMSISNQSIVNRNYIEKQGFGKYNQLLRSRSTIL